MAEENPSSEAPKPEKDDTDQGRPPRVPDPSLKSESSSPPPDRAPSTYPSPPPPPATGAATETLAAPNFSTQPAAAPAADGRSFSQLLAGAMASPVGSPRAAAPILAVPVDAVCLSGVAVPCFLAPLALLEPPGFTGQFAMTHQAVLASVTAQARIQMQAAHPSPEILSSSFPQPVLTAISPVPLQQRQPHVPEDNVCTPEAEQSDSSVQKPHPAQVVASTNSGGDGYNWRKYGQKQVKSGENYRSYYKCTDGSCSAKKKVERFPDGRVTEVMYRGQHNHDPPQQTRCLRVKGARFAVPVGENASLDLQSSEINESDPSISTTEKNSGNEMPEQQLFCSSDCEGDAGIKIEEDLRDESDPKRRLSESTITCSAPPLKTFREMKIVVHTACEMGPSTDGYKWRKYGQKIVKGNPNPRSYYRCTHTGCPVRKHVERASDDAKAIVMTYEGTHNHAMPGPRSSSDPPASPLPTSAAAASTTGEQLHTPDSSLERKPSTESPGDLDREAISEKALELGGENALLGIGLKSSAGVDGGGTESEGMKCTRFDENLAAVAVQNS